MGYFYSADLAHRIEQRLRDERFDLIFVHCSSVAPYVRHVKGIPKILDFGDMDSQKWLEYRRFKPFPLSLGYWLEGRKMQAAEKALARQFDLCTCTTKAELETLRQFQMSRPRPTGFRMASTATSFGPVPLVTMPMRSHSSGAWTTSPTSRPCCSSRTKCFREYARSDLLRRLRSSVPNLLQKSGAWESAEGITVTGTVPDVRDHVRRSAVSVAPLSIARGTQNKIIECMAMGVPVVTSPEAAGGVDAVPGEHLLVARSPDEYADKLLTLMTDGAAETAVCRGRPRAH